MPPSNPVPRGPYLNWPGIDEKPGEVHIDRAKLQKLAARLQNHVEELLAVQPNPVVPGSFGSWDAAMAFYQSFETGHNALVDQHGRVLLALMDMIKKLNQTAKAYDATEADLARRIAGIEHQIGIFGEDI